MSSKTTIVHCYQHTWCHTPEDTECHDNLKPSMFFKTKVTVCITNVVKKFCARHTPTLCRILLLLSSELQVSLKQWCTPELYQGVTENQVFWDVTQLMGEQFPAL